MKEMEVLGGVTGIITTMLLIPAGYYVDKKHPIRVGLTAMIWTLIFVALVPWNGAVADPTGIRIPP